MASIEKRKLKNGVALTIVFYRDGKKRKVYLGRKYKLKEAKAIKAAIESLLDAEATGEYPPRATRTFFETLSPDLKKRFGIFGLVKDSPDVTVKDALKLYVDEQRTRVKESTLVSRITIFKRLEQFVDDSKRLKDFTELDAERLKVFLGTKVAPTTVSISLDAIRAFFRWAIKSEYIKENPFKDVRGNVRINREREAYVSVETAKNIMEKLPTQKWRLLFACWRFAGMRRGEPFHLRENSFDLENRVVIIYSPKTERSGKCFRKAPIVDELLDELKKGFSFPFFEGIGEQNAYCLFAEKLENRGIPRWPRLIQNLRASFENDLVAKGIPAHVVADWMGHTVSVQEKHYLQVSKEYFERLTKSVG